LFNTIDIYFYQRHKMTDDIIFRKVGQITEWHNGSPGQGWRPIKIVDFELRSSDPGRAFCVTVYTNTRYMR